MRVRAFWIYGSAQRMSCADVPWRGAFHADIADFLLDRSQALHEVSPVMRECKML